MKYIIICLIIFIILFILLLKYLKKTSSDDVSMPTNSVQFREKPEYKEDYSTNNPNPSFLVELIDYKKNQLEISKSYINEMLSFSKSKKNRIKVYNSRNKYIGEITIKDYKDFDLIKDYTDYFEGQIYSFVKEKLTEKKVVISIQIKEECSKKIYQLDKSYLNKLISLSALFTESEIVETNYGPASVIDILEDHIVVDVPSLGQRKIYDIESLINTNN